jgi:hypothetical protein
MNGLDFHRRRCPDLIAMTVSTDLEWVRRDTGQAVWFWRPARGIREGFEEVRERLAASTGVPLET